MPPGPAALVVPNGVDVDHFIPALRMPGTPVVLFVSPLERDADVAAAAAFCRDAVPAVRRRASRHPLPRGGARPAAGGP